jgi:hypothetical protein
LSGTIEQIYGTVRVETSYGQLNTSRKIGLYLRHLATCAAGLEITESALVVRGNPRNPEGVETFLLGALEQKRAKELLGILCGLSILGRAVPLRFFPSASEEYFQALHNAPKKLREDEIVSFAFEQARKFLGPTKASARPDALLGELYRGTDPLGVLDSSQLPAVEASEMGELPFARLSEAFFGPLLRAEKDANELVGGAR